MIALNQADLPQARPDCQSKPSDSIWHGDDSLRTARRGDGHAGSGRRLLETTGISQSRKGADKGAY